MTMTKKKKRILLIAVPAALLVAAAGVILWLVLGRSEPYQPFEVWRSDDGNSIVYCAVKGEMEETVSYEEDPPFYTFTPPSEWIMTQDAMERNEYGYYDNADEYQTEDGAVLTFTQYFATHRILAANTESGPQITSYNNYLDPSVVSEVWFGDTQVIYYQYPSTQRDENWEEVEITRTGVYWVHDKSLLQLSCNRAMDINQMLELLACVDYNTLRQRVEQPAEPLRLERGGVWTETLENGRTMSQVEDYGSRGNPEIPEDAEFLYLSAPPQGYTLEDTDSNEPGRYGYYCEKYVDQQGELISYTCTMGESSLFSYGTGHGALYFPFHQMSWEELQDPNTVLDAQVNGNPAFLHIDEDEASIGWIDGYCTLEIRCTAPMTAEELIALAETVS